ncbi:MAG TPA: hypothetical protein VNP04_09865 [Alphaproteobacteria bacterium]|nr:hypothetical protein [Alphaproteobacteria bacterium]
MKDILSAAFTRYAELVRATLGNHRAFDEQLRETGILMLQPDKRIEFLPRVVEHLESREPFRQLVKYTRSTFPDQFHTRDDNLTRQAAQHFFRRCAFYLDVFEGKDIGIEKAVERYVKAFQRQDIFIWRLTLLDGIDFASPESCMNFGTFQIRRFSHKELPAILGNRVNQVFYPSATIDVKRLEGYWFLSTTCTQSFPQLEDDESFLKRLGYYLSRMDQIDPEYKRAAEEFPFGSPQQILSLFPWHKHMVPGEKWWGGFAWLRDFLPHSIETHDDFLSAPQPAPILPRLLMDTRVYDLPEGEQIEEECCAIWINLDENETQRFKVFVKHLEDLFAALEPKEYGWGFLERALAYFMKASRSTGLEQLLWHIVTMEVLLGETKTTGNASNQFKQRVNKIFRNKSIKKNGKKVTSIEELYLFRNDLIHGKQFNDDPVLVSHLTTAWDLARKTLLWFLHYLHAVQVGLSLSQECATAPSRDQLLKFLDRDNQAQQTLGWLKDRLPDFPHVREWWEWIE